MRRYRLSLLAPRERVLVALGITLSLAAGLSAGVAMADGPSGLVQNPDASLVCMFAIIGYVLGMGILLGVMGTDAILGSVTIFVVAIVIGGLIA
jgi:hypothetical protein